MHVLIGECFHVIADTHQNAKAGYLAIYGKTKIESCVLNVSLVAVEIAFILVW